MNAKLGGMKSTRRWLAWAVLGTAVLACPGTVHAEDAGGAKTEKVATTAVMPVDEIRPGMEGVGRTVMQGTEIVEFKVNILGVLKGVRPGQDIILFRCSGQNLEYTGVIAGMSGSPVYIDGKLIGAVAYTWQFNKEPIGGITPFDQMRSLSERPPEKGTTIEPTAAGAMPAAMMRLDGDPFVALDEAARSGLLPAAGGAAPMRPIAVPLAASGFTPEAVGRLKTKLAPFGLLPIAGGGASADVAALEPEKPIAPGAVLGASLVTGDLDITGLGTVTHVDGNKVWGWGHPYLGGGKCHYVLRAGHIHVVNPKQDVSTKLGSPLSAHGVIDADVSTCIAGELDAEADLLPMKLSFEVTDTGEKKEYEVRVVRHPMLLATLISTVLSSTLEAHGAVDQDVTIDLDATIRSEELEPIEIKNSFSGASMSGTRGVMNLLNQVALIADRLTRNPFHAAKLDSIECRTRITPKRTSAAITSLRLGSDRYEPGDELKAYVTLRPYKCDPVEVEMSMQLPESLEPGNYSVMVCDATMHLKQLFNEQPHLLAVRNLDELAEAFRLQLAEKRNTLYLRLPTKDQGLTVEEVALPQLPESVRAAFSSRRASPVQSIRRANCVKQSTDWVIEGATSLNFQVVRDRKVSG